MMGRMPHVSFSLIGIVRCSMKQKQYTTWRLVDMAYGSSAVQSTRVVDACPSVNPRKDPAATREWEQVPFPVEMEPLKGKCLQARLRRDTIRRRLSGRW